MIMQAKAAATYKIAETSCQRVHFGGFKSTHDQNRIGKVAAIVVDAKVIYTIHSKPTNPRSWTDGYVSARKVKIVTHPESRSRFARETNLSHHFGAFRNIPVFLMRNSVLRLTPSLSLGGSVDETLPAGVGVSFGRWANLRSSSLCRPKMGGQPL